MKFGEAFKEEWHNSVKKVMLSEVFNAWLDSNAESSYQRHVDGDLLKDIFESCLENGFRFGMTTGLNVMMGLAETVDSLDIEAKIKTFQIAQKVIKDWEDGK